MTEETKNTVLQSLWDKKFPQYLGTYFAVGFGALQFLEFLSRRYDISENFQDKYLLVWFALLPALLILIYFKGKMAPTTDSGTLKWPKFAVIGNVVAAFLLGAFLPIGKGKAAEQSEIVQLTNEEGKEIKAIVPAFNKVKSIACFQFENRTNDTEQDWWGTAFSNLLQLDLNQRPEYYASSQFELHGYYDRLGLEAFKLPNVGMQREIAQKSRSDYFTNISYTLKDNQYKFKGNLYSSRDGKSIIALSALNEDPYAAIDEIKQQIFDNIPNPFEGSKNEMELPASALISSNKDALKYTTLALITFMTNPTTGLAEVERLSRKSVELDPTCSVCSLGVGIALFNQGKTDDANIFVKNAVKYGASLPKRMQFETKQVLYALDDNTDAALKLYELRRKMFPYEFKAYENLLPLYMVNYGIDSAKVLIREAIDNGNIEKGLLVLYSLQVESEEYLEAEKTLDRYSKQFPDRVQDRMKYANIYKKQGKIEKAKEILQEEEALDPLKTSIQTELAYLDFRNLDISKAYTRLEKGLQHATTLSDSLNFLESKRYLLQMSGRIREAIQISEDYEKYAARQMPVTQIMAQNFRTKSDLFQSIGQAEKTDALITGFEKYSIETAAVFKCFAIENLIERNYEDVGLNEYLTCREKFQTLGEGYGEYFDVLVSYKAKDYEKCIEILNRNNEKIKKLFSKTDFFLVNIYNRAGLIDSAKKLLTKNIEQKPSEPIYYYQMAALLENENKKEAKEHLTIALKYWARADEDYIPLQRAKVLAERLAKYDPNAG